LFEWQEARNPNTVKLNIWHNLALSPMAKLFDNSKRCHSRRWGTFPDRPSRWRDRALPQHQKTKIALMLLRIHVAENGRLRSGRNWVAKDLWPNERLWIEQ